MSGFCVVCCFCRSKSHSVARPGSARLQMHLQCSFGLRPVTQPLGHVIRAQAPGHSWSSTVSTRASATTLMLTPGGVRSASQGNTLANSRYVASTQAISWPYLVHMTGSCGDPCAGRSALPEVGLRGGALFFPFAISRNNLQGKKLTARSNILIVSRRDSTTF